METGFTRIGSENDRPTSRNEPVIIDNGLPTPVRPEAVVKAFQSAFIRGSNPRHPSPELVVPVDTRGTKTGDTYIGGDPFFVCGTPSVIHFGAGAPVR